MSKGRVNRLFVILLAGYVFVAGGCAGLRFAPGEQQRQNAWLHNRTAVVAAERARAEQVSSELQALTELGELQSRAFVAYCGLPEEFPKAESAEDILEQANWNLARSATVEASARPDAWQVADAALELGIGIATLFGGVYGTRAVRFLKDAKAKSQALKEVVAGNELFKKRNADSSEAFKIAQAHQSPQTRQLVAAIKAT